MTTHRISGAEWLVLLAVSVLWGGSFFFSKVALAELPPFTVVLGRVSLAAAALLLAVRLSGLAMPRERPAWAAFFGMGLLNNLIPFSLIFWGQTQIASGLASILNATAPLFTVLVAHALTQDDRLTPARLAGVLLGLAGVAILVGPDALEGLGSGLLGQLACLAAALSYGFANVFGRRFSGTPPVVTAAGQVTATTIMMIPVALLSDRFWALPLPNWTTLGALAGLALLSTALAYLLFFRVLASAGATNSSLVALLIPASALFLGVMFLGERIALADFAGLALIGLGLLAMDGRLFRHLYTTRGS